MPLLLLLGVEIPMNEFAANLFRFSNCSQKVFFTAAITAMISAITKSPFPLIVAFAVFMALWILRQILPENILRDILLIFPANAVNVQEVLLLSVNTQSFCYKHPFLPIIAILLFSACGFLLFSYIAYKTFK